MNDGARGAAGADAQGLAELLAAGGLRVLDPARLRCRRRGAALEIRIEGEGDWGETRAVRAFPLTDERRFLSLRDAEDREIGIVADPAALPPADREALETAAAQRYLVPVVRRILKADQRFGMVEWDVETDRGRCRFATRDLRERALRPDPWRIVLVDVDENRYEVRDIRALSPACQALLLRHL
jgi:hypothetical protein